MIFTFSSANQYARMSMSFYEEYLELEEQYQKENRLFERNNQEIENAGIVLDLYARKEEKAISAVIFQALAIEAYINLLGVKVFGESVFNSQPERKSTFTKLNDICLQLSSSYPEVHKAKLQKLFDKRNQLVHAKTKEYEISPPTTPFDYDHPEKLYEDYLEFSKEQSFVFNDLDAQMNLYQEFQEHIRIIRGAKLELFEEMEKQMKEDLSRETISMLQSMFGIKKDGETF